MFADLNGTTIAYETAGDGPPLVLLNGVMMTMQSWALQVLRLSSRFRCVLHDFRGQLRSGKPGRTTLQQHVDDLRALLDHLGIARADVVGEAARGLSEGRGADARRVRGGGRAEAGGA
jgi:pimeloyl-ACP methyl ester carboxylesterase